MYEVMAAWERPEELPATEAMRDFAAIWRAADKVVYSRTLDAVSTERTRLEREFDADAVRALKESSERDLSIGGPDLAAAASPGAARGRAAAVPRPGRSWAAARRALPAGVRMELELAEERRFGARHGVPALPRALGERVTGEAGASRPVSQRSTLAPTSASGPSWRRPPFPANRASSGAYSRVWSVWPDVRVHAVVGGEDEQVVLARAARASRATAASISFSASWKPSTSWRCPYTWSVSTRFTKISPSSSSSRSAVVDAIPLAFVPPSCFSVMPTPANRSRIFPTACTGRPASWISSR